MVGALMMLLDLVTRATICRVTVSPGDDSADGQEAAQRWDRSHSAVVARTKRRTSRGNDMNSCSSRPHQTIIVAATV